MGKDGAWIDTAFLHGLGCAYGADIMIFQASMEPAVVGMSLLDDGDDQGGGGDPIAIPVALVNDYHFWGVMEAPDAAEVVSPVDKGEPGVFRQGLGLYPGPETATGDRNRVQGSRQAKGGVPGLRSWRRMGWSHQHHGN